MKEVKIFENADFGTIRTSGSSEQPLFCLADICKVLKLQVQNTKSRLSEDGVCSINLIDSLGRKQNALFINEQNLYKVIFQSRKKEAEAFVDWVTGEVLPTIRKTGRYELTDKAVNGENETKYITQRIMLAKFAMEALRMSESSKLLITSKICEGYDIPLPEYVKSNGVIKSASELLREHGSALSIHQFNKRMVEKGYLIEMERESKEGGIKKFKSLTDKGLEYGENLVSQYNTKETQPQYYVEKFETLLYNLK